MKLHPILATLALAVAVAFSLAAPPSAFAQTYRDAPNLFRVCAVAATPAQTFGATTYADLAGASCSFTPNRDPDIVEAGGTPAAVERLRITASIDGSKATSTTGSCSLYVNGAVVAATERFIATAAGRGTLSWVYDVAVSGEDAQTVKMQCRSGDTAVFTVNTGFMVVDYFSG